MFSHHARPPSRLRSLSCSAALLLSLSLSARQGLTAEATGQAAAVREGRFVYFSSIAAPDANKAFGALGRALQKGGTQLNSVTQLTIFVSDPAKVEATESALCRVFKDKAPPAVSIVIGSPLQAGAEVLLSGMAMAKGEPREAVKPAAWPALKCRSYAVKSRDTMFLAGFLGRAPGKAEMGTDVKAQAKIALEAVGEVLAAGGMQHKDVAAARVFLERAEDFGPMNEAYRPFFPTDPPARATVVAKAPAAGAVFQFVGMAVKHDDRKVVRAGAQTPRKEGSGPPYSPSIKVGERLYLAGTAGGGPPSDIGAQAERSLSSLGKILDSAGWAFRDVVDVLVYVTSPEAAAAVAPVLARTLEGGRYTVTTVGVGLVIPEPQVEIMLTAIDPQSRKAAPARPAK